MFLPNMTSHSSYMLYSAFWYRKESNFLRTIGTLLLLDRYVVRPVSEILKFQKHKWFVFTLFMVFTK